MSRRSPTQLALYLHFAILSAILINDCRAQLPDRCAKCPCPDDGLNSHDFMLGLGVFLGLIMAGIFLGLYAALKALISAGDTKRHDKAMAPLVTSVDNPEPREKSVDMKSDAPDFPSMSLKPVKMSRMDDPGVPPADLKPTIPATRTFTAAVTPMPSKPVSPPKLVTIFKAPPAPRTRSPSPAVSPKPKANVSPKAISPTPKPVSPPAPKPNSPPPQNGIKRASSPLARPSKPPPAKKASPNNKHKAK